MPGWRGTRPLKRWRYVGVFGARLMLCAADVHVGPARQTFWAVWDRDARRMFERTAIGGAAGVRLEPSRVRVDAPRDGIAIDLALAETDGIETICASGNAYAWTRKQGGVPATGVVTLPDGERVRIDAFALVDDSAGYHARHTAWRWSAGVGETTDGRPVAWNLVEGVNDPPRDSERTVWLDGDAVEAGAATFAEDLTAVATADGGALAFTAEATRERNENLLLVRSRYSQPFGTFTGTLPGGIPLATGLGVMEEHEATW